MPVVLTYPGVYIEEVPSGVRTITGVATSIALFLGWAPRGPIDRAARLTSFADFERTYGGLDSRSLLGYSVRHFFENGGADAYVLRIADDDAATATCSIDDLDISASSPGDWPVDYRVRLTRRADDATRFRLDVLHVPSNGAVVESFENLSMTETDGRFVEAMVNGRSAFMVVDATSATTPGNATVDLDNDTPGSVGTVFGPDDADFRTAVLASFGLGTITDRIDLFNLLCVPGLVDRPTLQTVQGHCRTRRAFLIVDAPDNETVATMPAALTNLTGNDAPNSALYFPWVRASDPLQGGALRAFPPCGYVAGVYARTDSTRGVWKAPAGSDASVTGASGLLIAMTDPENGQLNPRGDQLPAHAAGVRQRRVGRAHAARRRRSRVGVEVRAGAAHGALHRGEPLPRHAMGRVRAERRTALGADPAERGRLHAEPFPPGGIPGPDAARGLLREVRPAKRRPRTTSTSGSSISSSVSRRSSPPSSSSSSIQQMAGQIEA